VAFATVAAGTSAYASIGGTSIGVNFGADYTAAGIGPTVLLANEVAGVIPTAHWNNLNGANGTMSNLVRDANNVASETTASVSWTSSGLWSTDQENNTSQFLNPADEKLMNAYLDTFDGAPSSINFTGLTNGTYNVIVYSLTAVTGRDSGNITINGVQQKSTSIISTEFIQGGGPGGDDDLGGLPGNFNFYPNVVVNNGTLSLTESAITFRTAVNGIELVQADVPEPGVFGILAGGAAVLAGRRHRRHA